MAVLASKKFQSHTIFIDFFRIIDNKKVNIEISKLNVIAFFCTYSFILMQLVLI